VKGDSYCLYTKPNWFGNARFGMPEIHWGLEQIMDQLAEKIGMDKPSLEDATCAGWRCLY
jgi:hypothetical protein